MSQGAALESRVSALEKRVHVLEGKKRTSAFSFHLDQKHFLRLLGIFIVLSSVIALFTLWRSGQSANLLVLVWLLSGLWLIFRESSFFGISESTKVLLQEARTRQARPAVSVHHTKSVRVVKTQQQEFIALWRTILFSLATIVFSTAVYWVIMVTTTDPAWQLFCLLCIILGVLAYSLICGSKYLFFLAAVTIYVLCASSTAAFFAMLALLAISTGLLAYGWKYRLWPLLYIILLGTYLSVAVLLTLTTVDSVTSTLALLWPICLSVLVLMPATYVRRTAEERQMVRGLFACSALLVTLFVTLFVSTSPMIAAEMLGLLVALLLGQFILAWQSFGRTSYAKYFGFYGLAVLGVAAFLLLSFPFLVLLSFMVGVGLVSLSFIAQSYSARLAGVLLIGDSIVNYVFLVLPLHSEESGPWILQSSVWLGLLMSLFLILLIHWFRRLHVTGAEKRQERQLVTVLGIIAITVLYSVLYYTVSAPWQTMGWLLISMVALPYATARRLYGVQLVAASAGILSFFKLFLVDSLNFAPIERLFALIILGALLVLGAYLLSRYQHVFTRTSNRYE